MMAQEGKKRNVLHTKVSDEELAKINRRMEQLGNPNLSSYLRSMAINGYVLKLDLPEIREMIRLLSNMTNNLNQIAKRVNTGGELYETELYEIQENQQTLWNMMRQILDRLSALN